MHIAFIYYSTYAYRGSHHIAFQLAPYRIYDANTHNVPFYFLLFLYDGKEFGYWKEDVRGGA